MTNERAPSKLSGAFGLALAGCITLPIDPHTGESILDGVIKAFERDWLNGLFVALVVALPYVLGLCVAVATWSGGRVGATLVKVPLALLHLEVLLIALIHFHEYPAPTTLALLGFAIVMCLRLFGRAARSRARGTHASVGWLARSGGVLVAGSFGWVRLIGGDQLGIAVTATMVTAALMAVSARASD